MRSPSRYPFTSDIMTPLYPESLKSISIHAPHAYAVCMGIKEAEYRSQPTDRRGWILIHASQSKDSDHCLADYGISKNTIKRGAIIGAAQITDCTWDAEFECYAYHLDNPILFGQPIEGIKGCQAIFWGAKQPDKQAAFAIAWGMIEAATAPKAADISIEAKEIQQLADKIEEIAPQDGDRINYKDGEVWKSASPETYPYTICNGENSVIDMAVDIVSRLPAVDITQDLAILGYYLACDPQHSTEQKQAYQVLDSLTQEPLFQVCQGQDGWQTDLTKQIHCSPQLAIAEAREKTIGRIDRSRPLEVSQVDFDTFIIRNPDNGNHYAVHPKHPNFHERCECGDAHFRGVRCKHQIAADDYLQSIAIADKAQAELNQYIEQQAEEIAPNAQCPMPDIQLTSPDDFYNWDATANGKTIATIQYDSEHLTQRYVVAVAGIEVFRWNTQARAERYILTHYKQGTLPVAEVEKPESCTIEDCKFVDNKGQQYAFRIDNQLIGWIWLTDDEGDWYSSQEYWINGDGTKYDDWHECGLKLAQLTRNDLYQVVAA
jgi:hypothetical protein